MLNPLLRPPDRILVAHLFPETLDALVELLRGLSNSDWQAPTICAGWSVKDVAQHLLAAEVGILSRKRDGYAFSGDPIKEWQELVALINDLNSTWVSATRRVSPRLLCDLMRFTGDQANSYFAALDPDATGDPVDWAGPAPAPVWLDVAREYTERWHHQQQIRDAVGRPGLKEPRYLAPVLDAFIRALPHTYRSVHASEGAAVSLEISGKAGGRWQLVNEGGRWQLYVDRGAPGQDSGRGRGQSLSQATISLEDDLAWRLFTKGIRPETARAQVRIEGDEGLALPVLGMVSIIG